MRKPTHVRAAQVHVDEQQMRWFEQTLETLAQQQRQVVVFTHAPPQGCGLKVN